MFQSDHRRFSVLPGRTVIEAAKYLGEITWAVKAAGNGYVRNTSCRLFKEKFCTLHGPVFQKILNGRGLDCFLKTAKTFPLSDISSPGDLRQSNFAGIILMYVFQHFFNAQVVLT